MTEQAEGQIHAEDLIQEDPSVENPPQEEKTNEEVAREVIAGHWGRGLDRKKRLEDAGYDSYEINTEIAKILNQ